jgi:hypothetical protein
MIADASMDLPPEVTLAYCLGYMPSMWAIDFVTDWAALHYAGARLEIHSDRCGNLFLWVIEGE